MGGTVDQLNLYSDPIICCEHHMLSWVYDTVSKVPVPSCLVTELNSACALKPEANFGQDMMRSSCVKCQTAGCKTQG